LQLALILFVVAFGVFAARMLRRPQAVPALYWITGWVSAASGGILALLAREFPVAALLAYPLGTLFPALLLAGSWRLGERPVPRWLLPAALGLGSLRAALAAAGRPDAAVALSLAVEPAAVVAAGWLAFRAVPPTGATPAQRLLAPAFVGLAAVGAVHVWLVRPGEPLPTGLFVAWLVAGPLVVGLQVQATADRVRQRLARGRLELERRVAARTAELAAANVALRESEERHRAISEVSSDYCFGFRVAPGGRVSDDWVSGARARVTGYRPEELSGVHWLSIIHPEDRASVRALFDEVRAGKRSRLAYRIVTRDGRVRWLDNSLMVTEEDGGAYRVVGAARDVTEQKEAERALRASEERYRIVSSLSADYSFSLLVDPDRTVRAEWITPAFTQITGYEVTEIADPARWIELVHPEDRKRCSQEFEAAVRARGGRMEYRVLTKGGETRWNQAEFRLAGRRPDGSDRLVCAVYDVTERRRAEAERRQLEQHMQQMQKLESLGILAGGIAHDFNNLLTVVSGNVRLALDDLAADAARSGAGSSGRIRERLERIRMAATHATALTEQMLTYAGKSSISLEPLDLGEVTRGMLDLLRASVGDDCTLETDLAPALPAVEADAGQIGQVLLNLLINASEALEEVGRVGLSVGVVDAERAYLSRTYGTRDLPPGPYVYLEVRDEGRGMDAATQKRIFEPFFTTKFSGRGLGMAAVLGIVKAHRGAIRIESAPARGTVVRVLFPPAARAAVSVEAEPPVGAVRPGGGTVLVVDDDASVLELAQEFLRRAGFAVVTAGGGEEAVALLAAEPAAIDGVLLDLAMPGMDGEETFLALRALRSDLPVVLVSGYDAQHASLRFGAPGLRHFLSKPYEPAALVAKVEEALRTRRDG
jgi:PAS domain S-box-containing protein